MTDADAPGDRGRAPRRLPPWVLWPLLWAALFVAYYALHGERIAPDQGNDQKYALLTGDEPHYLLLTHSIALDGDIDLADNLAREDWRSFSDKPVSGYVKYKAFWLAHVRGRLREMPDEYWERRKLSVLPIGMPLLLAPWYRLGHGLDLPPRYTAALFFHAITALAATLMIWLCAQLAGGLRPALTAGGLLALSPPLLFYSSAVFPDMPGALLETAALCLLWFLRGSRPGAARLAAAAALGAVCGFLPWLHARFGLPAAILCLFFLWTWWTLLRREPRVLAAFGAPLALLAALLAWYFVVVFGVPYPVSTHPPLTLGTGITQGWPGLLFDRDEGLLLYAPLALVGFAALFAAARRGGPILRLALALALAQWVLIGTFRDWVGGLCPPLRYWVSAAPLFFLPAVLLFSRLRGWPRALLLPLGAAGVTVGVYGQLHPRLLYGYRHPLFTEALPPAWWAKAPQFMQGAPPSLVRSLLALAAFGCLCLAADRLVGARSSPPGKG